MKVSELEGSELDYWVAKAQGYDRVEIRGVFDSDPPKDEARVMRPGSYIYRAYNPSGGWGDGGPLIEEYEVELHRPNGDFWEAWCRPWEIANRATGATPLIAACRSIVLTKYGEEV